MLLLTTLIAAALFPNAPVEAAEETINSLFTSLRATIDNSDSSYKCSRKESTPAAKESHFPRNPEIERLQAVIDKLRAELGM